MSAAGRKIFPINGQEKRAAGLHREWSAVTICGIRRGSGSKSRKVKTSRRLWGSQLRADKAEDRIMETRQAQMAAGSGITWETEAAGDRKKRKAPIAARGGKNGGMAAPGNGRARRTVKRPDTAAGRQRDRTAAAMTGRKRKAGRGNRKNGGSGEPRGIPARNRTARLTGAGRETRTGRGNMRKPDAGWSVREKSWSGRGKNSRKGGNSATAQCRRGRAGSACTLRPRPSLSMRKRRSPKGWAGRRQRPYPWRRKENCTRK